MSNTPTPRTKSAQIFMAMPLAFGALLMVAVGILALLVWRGGVATGPRLAIALQGECAAEALPTIEQRIASMGLGDPEVATVAGGVSVIVTLPGQDVGHEQATIPRTLGRAGVLSVLDGETPLAEAITIEGAGLQLDENGVAMAVVELPRETARQIGTYVHDHPDGVLTILLDGEVVAQRPNTALLETTELRIIGEQTAPRDRMRAAADQIIVLQHGPLPCDLDVVKVETAE